MEKSIDEQITMKETYCMLICLFDVGYVSIFQIPFNVNLTWFARNNPSSTCHFMLLHQHPPCFLLISSLISCSSLYVLSRRPTSFFLIRVLLSPTFFLPLPHSPFADTITKSTITGTKLP